MRVSGHRIAVAAELALAAGLARWLSRRGWGARSAVGTAAIALPAGYLGVMGHHMAAAWLAERRQAGAAGAAMGKTGKGAPIALTRGGAVRAMLVEAADAIRAFGWLMPFRESAALPAPEADAPAGRLPVLLLHGYLCNRGLWHPLAHHLAARGHRVEAITLSPAFGSIDDYAEPVAAAIGTLRERTGARRVAVVGHSMGGLALRAYLRRFGNGSVATAVTLGTPHAGTRLARYGYGRNARQMRPASAWLTKLAAGETYATTRLFTTLWTRHDNIVMPRAEQTLPGARSVEVAGIGHLSLAFDAGVMRLVSQWLADASSALPAPDEDRTRLPG